MTPSRWRQLLTLGFAYSTALLLGWGIGHFAGLGFESRRLSIELCGPRLLILIHAKAVASPEGFFIERRQSPYGFPGAFLVRRSPLTGQWLVWLPLWAVWMAAVSVHGGLVLMLRGRRGTTPPS